MATKTITVTMTHGQLVIKPSTVTLTQNRDKLALDNSSGSTVYWFVPFGPLKVGGFHIAVPTKTKTKEKLAERHAKITHYTHRITLKPSNPCRKLGPKSDPIIIIDIER